MGLVSKMHCWRASSWNISHLFFLELPSQLIKQSLCFTTYSSLLCYWKPLKPARVIPRCNDNRLGKSWKQRWKMPLNTDCHKQAMVILPVDIQANTGKIYKLKVKISLDIKTIQLQYYRLCINNKINPVLNPSQK